MEKIEPEEVIKFFKEIGNIPRKSGNEEKIRDYLVEFAKERNLKYYTDKYFNVIIKKEASKGYEEKEGIAFQAHTDMICEKEETSTHDFTKDPIKLIKDGDFIRADGTTLGADNGIGMAFILALLDANNVEMPKIEGIFTVQEETTMIGAKEIDVNQIEAKKIISLDNGKEGKMVIASANCKEWFGKIDKKYIELENNITYELVYSNFPGGHSGGNIADEKRGNPIKLAVEILSNVENLYINNMQGGSKVNVIPRDCKVTFSCMKELDKTVYDKIKDQKEFYGENVQIELRRVKKINKALEKETTNDIINFIKNYKNGVIKLDKYGNVVLSANFGAVNEFDGYIRLEYSLRSNDISLRDIYLKELEKNVKNNNVSIIWEQELEGFLTEEKSNLVQKVEKVYKKMFNKDIEKIITQGVLEGGFFKSRINDLEYICLGPNIFDAHSPKERVSIESIQRTWNFIKEIIKEFIYI